MAAIKTAMQKEAVQSKCFWPRHIVRVRKGGSESDIVICFECQNYRLHSGGLAGSYRSISRDAQPTLDKILTDAGVPLAPKLPL